MRLLHVVGARPNFPKLAPVFRAARRRGLEQIIVHTGQHYDDLMSHSFFTELEIDPPDEDLAVGSASHAVQTARVMERFEPVLLTNRPDWVVVYGDVNSTVAASLVAAKLGVPTAHVEAGLRSDDRTMPEEINRIVTDRLATLLLTPSRDADTRLLAEGEPASKIAFVGNVMVDTLLHTLEKLALAPSAVGWSSDGSILVTLHRPSNVDDPERFRAIVHALADLSRDRRVIFPCHPRARARLEEGGFRTGSVEVLDPLPYPEMLRRMVRAEVVITDSGGIQEETTALGIPCLTVRPNTERPITVTEGTNRLVPDPGHLVSALASIRRHRTPQRPEGWDGRAGERVVDALLASRPTSARTGETDP